MNLVQIIFQAMPEAEWTILNGVKQDAYTLCWKLIEAADYRLRFQDLQWHQRR